MADVDLEALRRSLLAEIESYRYEVADGALGRPWPAAKVEALLAEMRNALVTPEWREVEIRDRPDGPRREAPERRPCVLVADDETYPLYYDPEEQMFFLANGEPPQTIGIWGDAVGCFLAR